MSRPGDVIGRRFAVPAALWYECKRIAEAQGRDPEDVALDAIAAGIGKVPERLQASAGRTLADQLDLFPDDPDAAAADAAFDAALDGF